MTSLLGVSRSLSCGGRLSCAARTFYQWVVHGVDPNFFYGSLPPGLTPRPPDPDMDVLQRRVRSRLLPPAESPRLARFCPPTTRSRLFARVCGPGRCSAVSRDDYRAVHGADRREYLCRAKFQYRGVDA